jgi:hypothetical protein
MRPDNRTTTFRPRRKPGATAMNYFIVVRSAEFTGFVVRIQRRLDALLTQKIREPNR